MGFPMKMRGLIGMPWRSLVEVRVDIKISVVRGV
jgi:hypothetical protein